MPAQLLTQPQSTARDTATREIYDAWHADLGVDVNASAPWHEILKPFLLEEEPAGKVVLEIGCGRGDFSCWIAATTGADVVGADFSATAIAKGRALSESEGVHLRWEVMDIQNIGHSENSFDLVISCETIEHVADPVRALRELTRVLRPGGKLFLTTPNYLNLIGLYRAYMRVKGTPFTETGQPINHFVTLPRTVGWVRQAGLRVLRAESRHVYLPIPGRPWTHLDWLDHPRFLTRWFGLHSFVIATK